MEIETSDEGEDIYSKLVRESNGNEQDAYAKFVELHNGGLLAAMEKEVERRKKLQKDDLVARTS